MVPFISPGDQHPPTDHNGEELEAVKPGSLCESPKCIFGLEVCCHHFTPAGGAGCKGGGLSLTSLLTWADIDWVFDTWQSDGGAGDLFIPLFIKTFANLKGEKKKESERFKWLLTS